MFLESYNTGSSTMAWLGLAGVGGRWWVLVGELPPFTPEKDGTSHQICSNGRFGSDLV
ncbi:nucleosidase [Corynebacterium diphtheriae]|nr:nucleosidase [Corynebacterium diphtheriae]